jgi:hypothetical protein
LNKKSNNSPFARESGAGTRAKFHPFEINLPVDKKINLCEHSPNPANDKGEPDGIRCLSTGDQRRPPGPRCL